MAQDLPLRLPAAPPFAPGALRPLLWPLAIAAALIGMLVWAAVLTTYSYHRERESARLEALSDLRADQVANWIADKLNQARFAGNSPLGEMYLRWQGEGDLAARDRLLGRLSSFHKASGAHSVLITDSSGEILASEPAQAGPAADELKATVRRAVATNTPQFTPFYGQGGVAPAPRIDVVSPLYLSGTPAKGLLVVRLDPRDFLLPLLNQWPVPSQTAAATLIRREGDVLVGPFGRNRIPLATLDLLAAKVLRGAAPFGAAVEGIDFRGQPALGVVRPVKGTDWFLVAKIDRGEVYADARRSTAWIAAAGLLALLAAGVAVRWWREREALRFARLEQAQQEVDRQRLEELVEQRTLELAAKNQSLERAVADLEAFGASVSHDLRGPLRTVNGFAALLQRSEGSNLSGEGQRKLGRILAGAATMDRMIEDILECSRAERADMRFGPVDLDALVVDLLSEMTPDYPDTQILLGALPVVRADLTMARQVFANLVGNALKFSVRQPRPRVEIGTEAPGGARVFVRDNGVGFETSQAGKLFMPFQRLHSEDDFAGTGVGLSIVKRLIERHGGSISAESVPGQRTTFTFDFGGPPST
jgi:signal transduction histidine kinase